MHHTQHISLKCSNYLPIWAAGLKFLIFCTIKFRSRSGLPARHSYGRLSVFSVPTHHHPVRHSAGSHFLLSVICSPALNVLNSRSLFKQVFTPGPCKLKTRKRFPYFEISILFKIWVIDSISFGVHKQMLNSVHWKSQIENPKNLVPRGLKPHTIKESDKLG